MFMKRIFAIAAALLLSTAAYADTGAPDTALKTATEQLQTLIKDNYKDYRADSAKFYKTVDDVVVPRFDVPYITKLVLATNYRTATAEQRSRFADAFKNMLMRSYANAMLDNYNSVKIEWLPPRLQENGTDALVNTKLGRDTGKAYAIGFRVHVAKDDWKIYDIVVEDISLITNFRTQLNSEIKKTSLDAVIARMENGEFVSDGRDDKDAGKDKKPG